MRARSSASTKLFRPTMFTGIIAALGRVESVVDQGGDLCLQIDASDLIAADEPGAEGESIAINGACMTARDWSGGKFFADVSRESLDKTSLGQLVAGGRVNLERAMRASDRLGGHLVSGHVDGVAVLRSIDSDVRSLRLEIEAPAELAAYIAPKGSVCLEGVSLTVNAVRGAHFDVNIIPHTAEHTTIGQWQPGARINIEVDLVARYLDRLLEARKG